MLKTFLPAALAAFVLARPTVAGGDLDPASVKMLHDYQVSMVKVEN